MIDSKEERPDCVEEEVTLRVYTARPKGHGGWARVYLDDNGYVFIASDYGDWGYWWAHRGEGVTPEQFLSDLDMHYAGKKLMGSAFYEYDPEGTARRIKEEIARVRAGEYSLGEEDNLEREEELLEEFEDGDSDFGQWCRDTEFPDAYEYSQTKPSPCFVNFWERLWVPHIQPLLRKVGDRQKLQAQEEADAK